MPRSRTGSILELKDGSLWARVRYQDEHGHRKERRKLARNRTDAQKKIKKMIRDLDDHGSRALDAAMTFAQWLDYYEKTYLIEAEYRDDAKVSGLRSYKRSKSLAKPLRAYFGSMKLSDISYSKIDDYRNRRLRTPKASRKKRSPIAPNVKTDAISNDTRDRNGVPNNILGKRTESAGSRSVASVNRELALLRRVLNVAIRDGWITRSPFRSGEPLIRPSDERHRERILSYPEEDRLLAVCAGLRDHLRGILICALDTGMRRGEIITLTWNDVDLEEQTISLRALNTKTIKRRSVPMSDRLHRELTRLWEAGPQKPGLLVFGIESSFKRSFAGACKDAQVLDFRFHDCRHTAATRWIQAGMSLQEVGRILGHTQAQTTYRYINVDDSAIRRAADILNEIHRQREEAAAETPN